MKSGEIHTVGAHGPTWLLFPNVLKMRLWVFLTHRKVRTPTAMVFQVEGRWALHLQAKQSVFSFISEGVIIPDDSFVFIHLFLTLFLLCNYLDIYTAFIAILREHLWASTQFYHRDFLRSSEKLQGR